MSAEIDLLTVHVLDTACGLPATGMALTLLREGEVLAQRVTNADGRCDAPLLAGEAFRAGTYEVVFDVAGWRAGADDPGFYDRVTIRFMVGNGPGHVHIPLLLSPYGYATYKGS